MLEIGSRLLNRDITSIRFPLNDRFRLLNLRCWSVCCHVSVEYILRCLLCGKYVKPTTKAGRGGMLGVWVRSLASQRSRAYVEECIARDFPGDEHVTAWQHHERRRLLRLALVRIKSSSAKMIPSYWNGIEAIRHQLRAAQDKYSRRPWRCNPWRS